jgi:hypothetical protein
MWLGHFGELLALPFDALDSPRGLDCDRLALFASTAPVTPERRCAALPYHHRRLCTWPGGHGPPQTVLLVPMGATRHGIAYAPPPYRVANRRSWWLAGSPPRALLCIGGRDGML